MCSKLIENVNLKTFFFFYNIDKIDQMMRLMILGNCHSMVQKSIKMLKNDFENLSFVRPCTTVFVVAAACVVIVVIAQ